MPELPEVETICRQLNKVLAGQRIKKIEVLHRKSLQGETLKAVGKRILGVKRKAKMIIINLGSSSLLVHLKMTGQLIYNSEETKHTRVIFELDKGRLLFNDLRLFGWVKVLPRSKILNLISNLPPDVVDKEFTPHFLQNILRSSGQAIKIVLVDQSKLGGVGNIYANEALYCAGIRPDKTANQCTSTQVHQLYQCLKQVIEAGIKYGGATASDENYVNALGLGGKYQEHFLVYERNGQNCRRCGKVIAKIKLAGRGTYYCPGCQK